MRSIVVTLHRAADLSATLTAMRLWLGEQRCERAKLTCDRSPGWFVIRTDFDKDDDANAFQKLFGGSDRGWGPRTIAKACWWRLMAEEIRTEADDFSSASAKDAMLAAARTLESLARDLERRLEQD